MKNDKGLPCIIYRCPEKIDENKKCNKTGIKGIEYINQIVYVKMECEEFHYNKILLSDFLNLIIDDSEYIIDDNCKKHKKPIIGFCINCFNGYCEECELNDIDTHKKISNTEIIIYDDEIECYKLLLKTCEENYEEFIKKIEIVSKNLKNTKLNSIITDYKGINESLIQFAESILLEYISHFYIKVNYYLAFSVRNILKFNKIQYNFNEEDEKKEDFANILIDYLSNTNNYFLQESNIYNNLTETLFENKNILLNRPDMSLVKNKIPKNIIFEFNYIKHLHINNIEKKYTPGKIIKEASSNGIYEGTFNNKGEFDGFGIFKFNTGEIYEGEYKNGIRNGKGKYTFLNGDIYDGDYKDGLRDGNGDYIYKNGNKFTGKWVKGIANGYGEMYWINGDYFKGNWENDKRNGEGTFYQKAKDKIYKGIWKNNKKIK
jgi:hypothetical protein